MKLEDLRKAVDDGSIDTVLLCIADMEGRLQGKRLTARHFLDEVVEHNAEGCNYLLAVDVDMNTVEGYAITSWDRGYGDMEFVLDLDTLRVLPHLPATAMVQCDLVWPDHKPVVQSPRTILAKQVQRAADLGYLALAGTELEFILMEDSYEQAFDKEYRGLVPSNQYNVDYSILGTTRVEAVLRDIRNATYAAGMNVEGAKGECNFGQHEIGFLYADALTTADNHAVYKTVAKEIAAQHGQAITFMAKYDEREGNSCHIHLSLRGTDGTVVFADDDRDGGRSELFERFLAGQLAALEELCLFYAPNINSYKRFALGSFAPTAVAWGNDNRTCALRVVGHGAAKRIELRLSGADVNPYLAIAGIIAAGLHGMDAGLELEPPLEGNAYASDKRHVPRTLRDARDAFAASSLARDAFGQEVVDHYLNNADVELRAFEAAVTDWERFRGFERL